MVVVPGAVLDRYERFSLYNSPYPAHDGGCAVDLYPGGERAPSPVAGEVVATRTVRAPDRPHAVARDHLVVVDTGTHIARLLHVDPAVEPGDSVAVGDDVGRLVRSGHFAPWVENHVHLGFRERDADAVRASGSLPVALGPDVDLVGVPWDGVGRVIDRADTYAVFDSPTHPAPGDRFATLAADDGTPLDGGLPHYDGGGALDSRHADGTDRTLSLLGASVGRAAGRTVAWRDVAVRANDRPVTGLSLAPGRDALGVRVVYPDDPPAVGERVRVTVE